MEHQPDVSVAALRRLAQGLLYDRHGAEDVVQEAWLAALTARAEAPRLGAWLNEAVKRLARNRRREEARRRGREERVARPEALAGADERAAQIEILHRLLDALARLEEPYRSAVMLRYLDDLPPRELARRLGLPVNTARTHVRRGLERLRRDLDGERGRERQGLLAALVPFAGEPPWTGAWRGAPLSSQTAWLAGAIAVVIGVPWAVLRFASGGGEAGRELEMAESSVAAAPSRSPDPDVTLAGDERGTREPAGSSSAALNATWIVRGHVTKADRAPLAGAPIRTRLHEGFGLEGTVLVESLVVSDGDGDFEWALAAPQVSVTVWVQPELRDHRCDSTWETVARGNPPPQQLLVRATPFDAWIAGTVRSAAGEPVEHARVKTYGVDGVTDAAGRFELRGSSYAGDMSLEAEADGHGQARVRLAALAPNEHRAVEIVLTTELRLRGRVIDEQGAPVAGARITNTDRFESTTTSDSDGRFELGGWSAETTRLSARIEKDGFATLRKGWDPKGASVEDEITLVRGRRVAGRVLDPQHAPIEGAEVGVGHAFQGWMLSTYTDAEGRFALEHVPPEYVRLEAWRRGLVTRVVELDDPAVVPAIEELELVLERGHSLGGVLLDPQSAPVPWTPIAARQEYVSRGVRARSDLGWVVTDTQGRFRFEGLPPGKLQLDTSVPGSPQIQVEVVARDQEDLVLQAEATAGLAGRVVDAQTGAPIRTFVVRVLSPLNIPPDQRLESHPSRWSSGLTFESEDGRWKLARDLPAGKTVLLEIEAPGYARAAVGRVTTTMGADPDALVTRLERGATIRGRVVEAASGVPLAGARVERRPPKSHPLDEVWGTRKTEAATTDSHGEFELRDVPAGEMSLGIVHASWAPALDGPFEVRGTETIQRWIELGSGGRISGRLLDASGNGIAGESVTLWGAEVAGEKKNWSATTGSDGSYALADLPDGTFQLQWMRELGGLKVQDLEMLVTLSGGEKRVIDLQPRGRTTVRGTVTFTGGALPEVVPLYLRPREAAGRWADGLRGGFAVNGRYEITHVEAGAWTVAATPVTADNSIPMGSTLIDVPAEGAVEANVVIEPRR